jgi:hypothetical protein
MGSSKAPTYRGFFFAPERGIMPRQPARHCDDYSPGHTPHFIQGLRSVEKDWVRTKVEYLGSNIFQLELEDGRILTRFNHEPGRLIEHLDWFGQEAASFQSDFYLLGIETGRGKAMFSLSKHQLEECKLMRTT